MYKPQMLLKRADYWTASVSGLPLRKNDCVYISSVTKLGLCDSADLKVTF